MAYSVGELRLGNTEESTTEVPAPRGPLQSSSMWLPEELARAIIGSKGHDSEAAIRPISLAGAIEAC